LTDRNSKQNFPVLQSLRANETINRRAFHRPSLLEEFRNLNDCLRQSFL
jgi:hypothetical protein